MLLAEGYFPQAVDRMIQNAEIELHDPNGQGKPMFAKWSTGWATKRHDVGILNAIRRPEPGGVRPRRIRGCWTRLRIMIRPRTGWSGPSMILKSMRLKSEVWVAAGAIADADCFWGVPLIINIVRVGVGVVGAECYSICY